MKHILKRTLALGLALVLSLSMASGVIHATALGNLIRKDSIELSQTGQLTHGVLQNSGVIGGLQTENVVEYAPESGLRPMVAFGKTLYGRSTLDYVASYLGTTGKTPVAGINGSFFDMATGVPIGAVVTEGILRSSGDKQSVGFFADGRTIIGNPNMDINITYPDGKAAPSHYNKTLTKVNGTVLYSGDFDVKTKNTIKAYNVILQPETATLQLGQTIQAKVAAIVPDTASCEIPVGGMVLSMANETAYPDSMQNYIMKLQVGDTITIESRMDTAWQGVQYVCGGGDMLVENGVTAKAFTLDSAKKRVARTAVGIKADGTLVMYAMDGSQSGYSAGLTLWELADRMAELGCVTALNLDGGGSTTLSAQYPGNSSLLGVNKPSDGIQRKCANFIFLARDTQPAGEAVNLHVYPYDAAVLAGADLQLNVKATDANYLATIVPGTLTYSATGGMVSENGIFTAGTVGGEAVVTVQSDTGVASGSRSIRVVDKPSSIAIKDQTTNKAITSLTVGAGKTVDLMAAAKQYGYDLYSQDKCFAWTATGDIGTVDAEGKFTAVSPATARTGAISAEVGGVKATVNVTVSAQVPEGSVILGFEPSEQPAASGTGLAVSQNRVLSNVRYGAGSLKAQYDLTKDAASAGGKRQVKAAFRAELPADINTVGLWVLGDNSNNSLSLEFQVGGADTSKWVSQLNFTGWKYVTAEIPQSATAVTGLAVTEYEGATATAGTIYLDQLIAAKGNLADATAPTITAGLTGTSLTIAVTDTESGVSQVAVTVDGKTQSFAGPSGILQLPADNAAHKVLISAKDNVGNLSSKTVEMSGNLAAPFADTEGHWSSSYVNYCYREGIMSGSTGADGKLAYRPDASMTRQEFAVALVRFLGLNAADYTGTNLPFADSAKIDGWALDAVKAAYSLGLLTGSTRDGKTYVNPTATITRQETMALLSRTQIKGYAEDDLKAFSDAATVADWARSDIAAMVSRGIISGSKGLLKPNGTVTRAEVAKMLYNLY